MKCREVYVLKERNTYRLCEYIYHSTHGIFDCHIKMLMERFHTVSHSSNMYGPISRMKYLSLDQVKEQFPEYFI